MKLGLFFILGVLSFGHFMVATASVFESQRTSIVSVKAIAVGESIKIKTLEHASDGEVRPLLLTFCRESAEGDRDQLVGDINMDKIREAMRRGERLRLRYSALFDHCISKVTVLEGSI